MDRVASERRVPHSCSLIAWVGSDTQKAPTPQSVTSAPIGVKPCACLTPSSSLPPQEQALLPANPSSTYLPRPSSYHPPASSRRKDTCPCPEPPCRPAPSCSRYTCPGRTRYRRRPPTPPCSPSMKYCCPEPVSPPTLSAPRPCR